jgi:hypothetical protein
MIGGFAIDAPPGSSGPHPRVQRYTMTVHFSGQIGSKEGAE